MRWHMPAIARPVCEQQGSLLHLQAKYAYANLLLPALPAAGGNAAVDIAAPVVEQFVSAPLPRAPGLPLVDDWNCLRVRTLEPKTQNLKPCSHTHCFMFC